MGIQSCVHIDKEWDIVAARQLGRNVAKDLGFRNVDQARIATAISELARNIYSYAGKGRICIDEVLDSNGKKGIKIAAIDSGPGVIDIKRVMEDGYSTSGGLGAGLPGVKRLMDKFDLQSEAGEGTTVTVVKWMR